MQARGEREGAWGWCFKRHSERGERKEARAMKREKREIGFNSRVGLIFNLGEVYFNSGWIDFKWVSHVIY